MAAQARLEKLRERFQTEPAARGRSKAPLSKSRIVASPLKLTAVEWGQQRLQQRRRQEALAQGERASDALKSTLAGSIIEKRPLGQKKPQLESEEKDSPSAQSNPKAETVKVYPSIALGMLKANLEAAGRVWLFLQYLDPQGRGWLATDDVREKLTDKKSSVRICSWRRLRQVFSQGEGTFWTRDDLGRIWLRGAAKVAAALSVDQLTGRPVGLPLSVLLGGIQGVRAHFYASFHSGRRKNNPISRETLRELTGVPERTQYAYEQAAGVSSQQNIAVGEYYTPESVQERAWQHGRAVFHFVDFKGKQGGQLKQEYVAWHLPNSYEGPHRECPRGRQKKINQKLVDLVIEGFRGNDQEVVEKIFWLDGAMAGKAYNRNPTADTYWPGIKTRSPKVDLWHVLGLKRG